MIKKTSLVRLAATLLLIIGLSSCSDDKVEPADNSDTGYSIFIMSDIHVMSPELLIEKGEAYESYVKDDPKMLEESAEVLNAAIEIVLDKKPDLVLIPGDLTKDGELLSHQLVVSMLERIRTVGIPVIVIPGNHDIDNPKSVYFMGDVTREAESILPEQFARLYRDYGYSREETVRDPASLSFTCEPLPGLVLICLDTNRYEENLHVGRGDTVNHNQTAGRIRKATLEWMWEQADLAHSQGKQVIAMQHHNAVEHYDGQATLQFPYVVENYRDVAEGMIEHGIHLVLTGHQHLHDIAQYRYKTDNIIDSLVDISTGSVVSYPNAWRIISVNRSFTKWNVSTGYIKSIPSVADMQTECYNRLMSNLVYGLAWHIKEFWPTIESYRNTLSILGLPPTILPDTPQQTTRLLMEYLGTSLSEGFMIHNAGNENRNPRSGVVIDEFEEGVHKLCTELLKNDSTEEVSDRNVIMLQMLILSYVKPYLTSMLTDTNQMQSAALSSVTDDLNVELGIPLSTF